MIHFTFRSPGARALLAALWLTVTGCAQPPSLRALPPPATTALTGHIECAAGVAATPVVVAIELDYVAPQVRQHRALAGCGDYRLQLSAGRFVIAAFDDRNGNGRFDAGEALAEHPALVTVDARPAQAGIDIMLGTTAGTRVRAAALGLDRLRHQSS